MSKAATKPTAEPKIRAVRGKKIGKDGVPRYCETFPLLEQAIYNLKSQLHQSGVITQPKLYRFFLALYELGDVVSKQAARQWLIDQCHINPVYAKRLTEHSSYEEFWKIDGDNLRLLSIDQLNKLAGVGECRQWRAQSFIGAKLSDFTSQMTLAHLELYHTDSSGYLNVPNKTLAFSRGVTTRTISRHLHKPAIEVLFGPCRMSWMGVQETPDTVEPADSIKRKCRRHWKSTQYTGYLISSFLQRRLKGRRRPYSKPCRTSRTTEIIEAMQAQGAVLYSDDNILVMRASPGWQPRDCRAAEVAWQATQPPRRSAVQEMGLPL